ncbi:lectin c-type domain-containing protein [Ditylenchus destructor]|uniref:Lectin c-type domain-containing protein n=1 Tax=Ditylenchus destructor TaxID=166010 RepID=A0AAD4N434_9BILA|nr:lectin c-type domain-containing protein [Ditylenchus destructor]
MADINQDAVFIFQGSENNLKTSTPSSFRQFIKWIQRMCGRIRNLSQQQLQKVAIISAALSLFFLTVAVIALIRPSDQPCEICQNCDPCQSCDQFQPFPQKVQEQVRRRLHCDFGWTLHYEKCYKIHAFWSRKTFAEAETVCHTWGGELVSIHSLQENKWISEFARGSLGREMEFFIGLKLVNKTTRLWTDNSPLDFEIWHTGEPNGGENEACVELRAHDSELNGFWNDVSCDRRNVPRRVMCQKGASVSSV